MSLRSGPRLGWIDICKGIGICAVVYGHNSEVGLLHSFVYLWHMPLFFFLGGYLHHSQTDLAGYFRKKAIHLLLPYAVFVGLFAPLEYRDAVHSGITHLQFAENLIWGGSRLHGACGVAWFLTCFFLTQQITNFLLVRMRPAYVAGVGIALYATSLALSHFVPRLEWPFNAHVVLAAAPIFLTGFWFKRAVPAESAYIRLMALAGTGCSIVLIARGAMIGYDMRQAVYGIPILTFGLSIACVCTVMLTSQLIAGIPALPPILRRLGTYSLAVMFLHKVLHVPRFAWRWIPPAGWGAFLLVLMVSFCLAAILHQSRVGRALFFGVESDFLWLQAGLRRKLGTASAVVDELP